MDIDDKELTALLAIDKIIKELNDEDSTSRILNYIAEKYDPYIIWSKRDLLRNIERVIQNHSELMYKCGQIKSKFCTIEDIGK